MDEYIDRKQALDLIESSGMWGWSKEQLYDEMQDMPSADVALVVHGRWGMHSDRPDTLICSICDHAFDVWKHDIDRMHYCPNCGAKMDLKC